METTQKSYTESRPRLTAEDINWELQLGLWPSATATRIFDLELERDAYRDLLQATLKALHDVTLERDMLRQQRRIDRQRAAA